MALIIWARNKPESVLFRVGYLDGLLLFEVSRSGQITIHPTDSLSEILSRAEYGGCLASCVLPCFESVREFAVSWTLSSARDLPVSRSASGRSRRLDRFASVYSESIIGSDVHGIVVSLEYVPLGSAPDEAVICPRFDGRPRRLSFKQPDTVAVKCRLVSQGGVISGVEIVSGYGV
jgi:hypothetical protein